MPFLVPSLVPSLVASLVLAALCTGFAWPGRLHRLEHDLGHADASRRRDVVRELAGYPAEAAQAALLDALEDDDLAVRLEAAQAAGRVRLAAAVPILRDWLDDANAETRAAAASALGAIGDARARDGLLRALGDATAEVRRVAVDAAAALGGDEAVPALVGALDDRDVLVRVAVVEALGRLGDARALVPLGGVVRDDAPEVREAVMRSLGRLRDARALASLEQGLADSNENVRLAAAGALGRVGDADAVRALARVLRGPDARLARAAVAALGGIDDARATDALVAALDEESLREGASDALAAQATRIDAAPEPNRVVGALVAALVATRDAARADARADALSRVAAVAPITPAAAPLIARLAPGSASDAILAALARSGSPDGTLPLLEQLDQSQGHRRDVLLDALAEHFQRVPLDGRAADPLLAALPGASPAQQLTLVRLLGRVGAPRSLTALRPLLASERATLQHAAIEAVTAIGDSASVPAFLSLLGSTDHVTRALAASALSTMADDATTTSLLDLVERNTAADPGAVFAALGGVLRRRDQAHALPAPVKARALRHLARACADEDSAISDAALDALVVWRPREALATVAGQLRSPSSRRRALAAAALSAFAASEARGVLRYVLHHDTPEVAAAAATALGEVGDERDLVPLVKAARHMHWPVPAATSWAIARMAERGVLKEHATARLLCDLGRARNPYVRANVAVAMGVWGAAGCPRGGPDPLVWLASAHDAGVRIAAAHWTREAATARRIDAAVARAALDACATRDGDPDARAACAARERPRASTGTSASVLARAVDGATPLPDGLVALRFASGAVRVGATDSGARMRLAVAPTGAVTLGDPGLAALEPESALVPASVAPPSTDAPALETP